MHPGAGLGLKEFIKQKKRAAAAASTSFPQVQVYCPGTALESSNQDTQPSTRAEAVKQDRPSQAVMSQENSRGKSSNLGRPSISPFYCQAVPAGGASGTAEQHQAGRSESEEQHNGAQTRHSEAGVEQSNAVVDLREAQAGAPASGAVVEVLADIEVRA